VIYAARIRSLTSWLLESEALFATKAPNSWFGSNRLVLPDAGLGIEEKLVAFSKTQEALAATDKDKAADHAKSQLAKVTLSLRGRDLSHAVLDRADLRQVDLIGADMRRSSLQQTQLQGAYLSEAQLRGAYLQGAQLQGAELSAAQLQGADLTDAQLQGADLTEAQLQGADLPEARLQGADLTGARLQGADLTGAWLRGANLTETQLEGADLTKAQLQGTDLSRARLHGADLSGAQLQGANLSGAQLQGATLARANVYRTLCPLSTADAASGRCLHGPGASIADARRVDLSKSLGPMSAGTEDVAFRKFVDDVLREVPAEAKERAKERLSVLEPGARTPEQDAQLVAQWRQERVRSLSPARRAHGIARLACGADEAPHIARGLMRNGRLEDTRQDLHDIAAKMRSGKTDASKCEGVRGFVDADWKSLDELVKKAPPKPDAGQPRAGK
jgi:uncharacterized protein YjbI with pentapeptide repeats